MKKWTLGLVLVVAFSLSALAQSGSTSSTSETSAGQSGSSAQMGDTATTGKKSKSKSSAASDKSAGGGKTTSITGCLQGSAGNYTLTNGRYKNGVAVTAASGVDLAPHVGHEVRLTGTWEKGSGSSAAGGTSASKTFNATAMKHISDTCTAGGGKAGSKTKGKSSGMSEDTGSKKSDTTSGSTKQ